MAWRALARRCPVRSFTVVGDLAQYSGPHAPGSWARCSRLWGRRRLRTVDDPGPSPGTGPVHAPGRQAVEEALSVCYRTPATIMEVAEETVTQLGHPPVYPVRSVRDLPDCLDITEITEVASEQATAARAPDGSAAGDSGAWGRALARGRDPGGSPS